MYAVFLNSDNTADFELELDEHLSPQIQSGIFFRSLWGFGNTEEEAIEEAVSRLLNFHVIETFECDACVQEVIQKSPTKRDALRHLWVSEDDGRYPRLFALPHHDTLLDFCARHSLSDEAKRELETFFNVRLFVHNSE